VGKVKLPFKCLNFSSDPEIDREVRQGVGFLLSRLRRDGWTRDESRIEYGSYPCPESPWITHDEWVNQPSKKHPTLRIIIRPHSTKPTYRFELDQHEGLIDEKVTWATWDYHKNLIMAREGVISRYTLKDIAVGAPGFECDLEPLQKQKINV